MEYTMKNLFRKVTGFEADEPVQDNYMKILENVINFSKSRNLYPKEEKVLFLHWQQGLTFAQIGKQMGLSEARISQLGRNGVRKLRYALIDMYDLSPKRDSIFAESIYLDELEAKANIDLNTDIEVLGLDKKLTQRLRKGDISTLKDLCRKSEGGLLLRDIGGERVNRIKGALQQYGLALYH